MKFSLTTGYLLISAMHSGFSAIASPSNHGFPRYSMLKKASTMLRFRDFPNLRGRVIRKEPVPL